MEGVANFGRRVKERGGQAATGALVAAGVIPNEWATASLASSQKRLEAAAPGSEIQKGLDAFGQVKTFGDAFRVIAENPAATFVTVAESAALSMSVMAVAALAGLPALGTAAVAGGTSAALELGSVLTDQLGDKGIDARDVVAVGKALDDPAFMAELRKKGAIRGLTIGAIDGLTAGMAGRFIKPVMEAVEAGKITLRQAGLHAAAAATKELSTQVAGGAGGEALAQALTGENKPFDVVIEGIAEGFTFPGEAASNIRGARKTAGNSTPEAQFARALEADVRDTYFKAQPVQGYAARAGNSQFHDPALVDPRNTVRTVAPRVEDMPDAPMSAEQIAALAETARMAKAQAASLPVDGPAAPALAAADPADLRRRAAGLRAAGVPSLAPIADQMDAQAAEIEQRNAQPPVGQPSSRRSRGRGRPTSAPNTMNQGVGTTPTGSTPPAAAQTAPQQAGSAPGLPTIERGSIAAQARQALAARQAAAGDGQQQADGAVGSTTEAQAAPQVPPLNEGAGPSSTPPQADSRRPTGPDRQQPEVTAAASRPASVEQAPSDAQAVVRNGVATAGGDSLPRFTSRGQAYAWAVQNRRNDLEPVEASEGWELRSKLPQADDARSADPYATATAPRQQQADQAPAGADARNAAGAGVVAQHIDSGQQPEAATQAVVRKSISTAAANLTRKPSELKADLLQQIDDAIGKAPSTAEVDAQLDLGEARQNNGKQQMNGSRWFGASRTGPRTLIEAREVSDQTWSVSAIRVSASGSRQAERIGTASGTPAVAREQIRNLMRRLQPDGTLGEVDQIEIDVPGDGKFTVVRTKERLAEFRKRVDASPGFKDRQAQPKADGPTGTQKGSPSVKAAISSMLDEGDAQAAVDYAQLKGIDIRSMGLSPAQLAKINGLTPTADATETDPESAPAPAAERKQGATPAAPVATPDPLGLAGKMPHELTAGQFIGQVSIARTGDGKAPWTATWRGQPIGDDSGTTAFATRKAAADAVKAAHERAVQRAQQRGEAVPDAVKAEYAVAAGDESKLPSPSRTASMRTSRPRPRSTRPTSTASWPASRTTASPCWRAARSECRSRLSAPARPGRS